MFLRLLHMGAFEIFATFEFNIMTFMLYSFIIFGWAIQMGIMQKQSGLKRYSLFILCFSIIAGFEIYQLIYSYTAGLEFKFIYMFIVSLIIGDIFATAIKYIKQK